MLIFKKIIYIKKKPKGVGAVVERVKLLHRPSTSHTGAPGIESCLCGRSSFLPVCLGSSRWYSPRTWVPAVHTSGLDERSNSWLSLAQGLLLQASEEWTSELKISLPVPLSAFQIKKQTNIYKFKNKTITETLQTKLGSLAAAARHLQIPYAISLKMKYERALAQSHGSWVSRTRFDPILGKFSRPLGLTFQIYTVRPS